jgi:hypothetical protein
VSLEESVFSVDLVVVVVDAVVVTPFAEPVTSSAWLPGQAYIVAAC